MHWIRTCALISLLAGTEAEACTAFKLKSLDGAHVYCRSMEFGYELNSSLLIVPRDSQYVGSAPNGQKGMKWSAKYGFVGLNQSFLPTVVSDGMNEKGLVASCLYLPGFAEFQASDPAKLDQTIAAWELPAYLLCTCATIDEVKAILPKLVVAKQPFPVMKDFYLPIHFYVADNTGATLVVEYVKGELHIYDNKIGSLTNSPPFDWQKINLSNFVNLSPLNVPALNVDGTAIQNFGQGSGLLGIPGDYTPPSRFVRASLYSDWATPQKTGEDAVRLGFHILNTFDIFDGIVRDKQSSYIETTEWTVVHDQTNLKTYFRGYESLAIQGVDLKKIDFTKPGFRQVPIDRAFGVKDSSADIRPLVLQ